jgi:hypothetical protein
MQVPALHPAKTAPSRSLATTASQNGEPARVFARKAAFPPEKKIMLPPSIEVTTSA